MTTPGRPTLLADALRQYLDSSGIGERVEEAAVLPEWPDRVGPGIAAVTVPLRASRGTLVVGVRSSAWLMELKMMEREIIRRLNAGRERGTVRHVQFVMLDE